MSLAERRIEIYANTLARALESAGAVSGLSEVEISAVIRKTLDDDRKVELAIDDEARALMKQYSSEISRGNMDTGELLRKFRTQIAKKKGFSL